MATSSDLPHPDPQLGARDQSCSSSIGERYIENLAVLDGHLAVLVEMAKADNEGQKRFSPFWKIYLAGNPLSDGVKAQVETLKSLGARITE